MNAQESSRPDNAVQPPQQLVRPELATWSGGREEKLRHGGHVGIVLPCFNEEGNVEELYERLVKICEGLPDYTFEMLFIDNAATDGTVEKLKALVERDPRVKVIVRNVSMTLRQLPNEFSVAG